MQRINELLESHTCPIIPNEINREYKEFEFRLNSISHNEIIHLEDFIHAIKKEDENRISLCTFDRVLEDVKVDSLLEIIYKLHGHIRQVFMHPRIHLKETQQVLPVEIVNRIGSESIRYLASHSEHWESIRVSGLVPSRILARSLEDEYAIYENIVAKNLVDRLYLKMIKKHKDLKIIEYNIQTKNSIYALNKQQPNVYIAYTILFRGYQDDSLQDIRKISTEQLKMVEEILAALVACRESDLYNKLRRVVKTMGIIKPTNIFLMDKHYKYIYKMWKEMSRVHLTEHIKEDAPIEIKDEYYKFVFSEVIFALNNFNYRPSCDSSIIAEKGKFNSMRYYFKDWACVVEETSLSSLDIKGITLCTSLSSEYSIQLSEKANADLTGQAAYIGERNTLIVTSILNEEQQNDLCKLIYPELDTSDYRKKDGIKRARLDLKKKFWEIFQGEKPKEYKTLIIPLYTKFIDCSIEARKGIKLLENEIQNEIKKMKIDAFYLVIPFSPFDYEGTENLSQADIRQLIHYTSLNSSHDDKIEIGIIPVTIGDINSYRRITKILLLSMMALTKNLDKHCPICGQILNNNDNKKICYKCKYEIMEARCENCGKYYKKGLSPVSKITYSDNDDIVYKVMVDEIKRNFNNLVEFNIETNEAICPYCAPSPAFLYPHTATINHN